MMVSLLFGLIVAFGLAAVYRSAHVLNPGIEGKAPPKIYLLLLYRKSCNEFCFHVPCGPEVKTAVRPTKFGCQKLMQKWFGKCSSTCLLRKLTGASFLAVKLPCPFYYNVFMIICVLLNGNFVIVLATANMAPCRFPGGRTPHLRGQFGQPLFLDRYIFKKVSAVSRFSFGKMHFTHLCLI